MDAQSVKPVEESAGICGYDGYKCIKGHKRHLLVDTLSLPLAIYVTPADVSDPAGARKLLAGIVPLVPAGRWLGTRDRGARSRGARVARPTAEVDG